MDKSYAQLNQDIHVLSFFNNKKDGYYVDIGANDGVNISNTYLLEKLGWNGICAEPLPSAHDKLIKNRKCYCSDKAVYSESGKTLEFSQSDLFSGITQHIDRHAHALNGAKTLVKTITLNDLLAEYDAPLYIDYLSIDTEGTELEILNSVDLDKYIFGYINVEHNFVEPRRTEMKNLLLKHGYIYKGENRWDDDYIHKSLIEKTYYYNSDYSKPIELKLDGQLVTAKSSYWWQEDSGELDMKNMRIKWKRLGSGAICADGIDYGGGNKWHT